MKDRLFVPQWKHGYYHLKQYYIKWCNNECLFLCYIFLYLFYILTKNDNGQISFSIYKEGVLLGLVVLLQVFLLYKVLQNHINPLLPSLKLLQGHL